MGSIPAENQSELTESLIRFQEIGNASPVMMWTTTPDGKPEWFNRHWLEFTGQTLASAVATGRFAVMHEEDQEPTKTAFESAAELRDSLQIEYRLKGENEAYRWFVDRAAPRIDANGVFTGYVGVCIDISDQIEYRNRLAMRESVMQQLHSISERERSFLACAIHDGLLQDVIGSDMLVQGIVRLDEETQARRIKQIRETLHSAIRHGRRLISELRPMILDEQGLTGAVEYYAAEIENRSPISIEVQSTVTQEVSLAFWRGNVFRIIQEALNNVESHSDSPTAKVEIETVSGRLKVEVKDQGKGFDVEDQEDSFGIRCMKDRAEIYNGTVEIQSTDAGTTVMIDIPLPHEDIDSQ